MYFTIHYQQWLGKSTRHQQLLPKKYQNWKGEEDAAFVFKFSATFISLF